MKSLHHNQAAPMRLSACIALTAAVISLWGCGGAPPWIRKVPSEKNVIYAIGTGDPGLVVPPEEAALLEARKELGAMVKTRVISVLTVHSVGSDKYVNEVSDTFSDEIVQNAKLIDKWLDEKGSMGVENRLYVLVKFRKRDFVDGLKKAAEDAAKKRNESIKSADVEQAAQEAFDELDKAINERNRGRMVGR